ncbi:hypothetical protein Tco_1444628 [Tanacetum coccineum]
MDPYEEVAQQGQVPPLSPSYVPDPIELDEYVPVYVPELEHPEYHVPTDDDIQSMEEDSIDYPGEPEDDDEDPEEDPEEDHTDDPADEEDGDDEPSDDDDDNDDTDDEDEKPTEDEEEEEHIALADSSATRLRRARKTVRLEPPMSPSMEARIAEHAVAPTLPLPVSSPPLPLPSPLTTSPTNAGAPLGYKANEIRMRASLPSTSHRIDIPEAEMPPWKRDCFTTSASGLEVGESSAAGAAR